ncbi:arsenate reductase [Pedobacter deserti]|uniref:arsenate reductase n=1 Tax=Pedobacter deserti TaxID=2817382 RepID=UPI00351EAD7D
MNDKNVTNDLINVTNMGYFCPMIIYGIPNCNSVKKAITSLDKHGLAYTFHDFKKEGVTAEKLNRWCDVFGWEKVLNKKGTTWRKLSAEEQAGVGDQESAIALMLGYPSLIKRPVLEVAGEPALIGFDEGTYVALKKN